MQLKTAALIVGLLVTATQIHAQEDAAPEPQPIPAPSESAPAAAANPLQDLAASLETQFAALRTDIQSLKTIGEQSARNAKAIEDLRKDIDNLDDMITEHVQRQRQLLESLTRQDSVRAEKPLLEPAAETQAPGSEDEPQASSKPAPSTGLIHLHNRTSSYQTIAVNQVSFGINPATTLTLKVPTGEVITQMPGRVARSWQLASPNYVQNVDLVPAREQRTTTLRPVPGVNGTYYYYPSNRLFSGYYWLP
ncbi:MAG: hypothetical protein VX346_07230 [Planctomycetota bacterium]|nr:hypothetical protein [Planctomycetota bacterium]